jgi:hypothetical protein
MYRIKAGQREAARRLGVVIRPSSTKGKKIDVFKHGFKIASIGAEGYDDFWGYVQKEKAGRVPAGTASERRRLYKIRHAQECAAPGTPGYYACRILW